jgi:SAM-dependent methyltransferase
LPYAPGLADALTTALDLDGQGRLLDIGCGPGTLALLLAELFEEVVGLDPDRDMLREASRFAVAQGLRTARWVELRAEQLPAWLGRFRVVTFGASFHWLDRSLVASTVREMLVARGAVVQVDSRHQDHLESVPGRAAVPRSAIDALRRAFLGDDRRAGASIRNTSPSNEAAVFRYAGYVGPEVLVVPDGRVLSRTVDDVVAETVSMSATAPHLFGSRLGAFEADLRRMLHEAAPDGTFAVKLPDNECNIWRRARKADR